MGKSLIAPWRSPEGLAKLRAWRQQGLTCAETAARAAVGESTLRRWTMLYPEIRQAMERGGAKPTAGGTDAAATTACGAEQTDCAEHTGNAAAACGAPAASAYGKDSDPAPSPAPLITIDVQPTGGADLYSLARDAGLLPLSPDTDAHQLERLVESALLRRALGYRYATITSELRKDPVTGESAMVVTKRIDKDVPPDTSAQLFWLKCHAPERWRDKPGDEPEGDGEVLVTFDVDEEDGTDDEGWEEE